ncbi:hypothetical protein BBP00_00007623 [Phytophthora kernoviae]|uniref:Fibronectin type-III domain-containing protein n=1 Tax=Phytophthora kernoviae TaxID=325452 RepID=A0A3F2RHK5_9STRA|nr:hypothetical protein BBP00_00007623 [Phytophthora kernoviae]
MTSRDCVSLLMALCSLLSSVRALSFDVTGLKATACPYIGCVANDDAVKTQELFPTEMSLQLEGEKTAREYPAFPHSPLLVTVGTCDAVLIRWRTFEELLWPVERFVLQRYPDREDQPQWNTILDTNDSEHLDVEVQPGRRYAYRVQAVCKDNVSSAYEYHWTRVDEVHSGSSSICRSSGALLSSVNADGIRSLGLIFACFLTVYGLMRASVMGVQGTQSRSYRLKRIKNSTSEVCGYQASVDSFANAQTGMQMHSVGAAGGRGMGRRRSSLSQQHQKKLKIRTICRNCCDDMYRYSTHVSVRPSYVNSGSGPAIA